MAKKKKNPKQEKLRPVIARYGYAITMVPNAKCCGNKPYVLHTFGTNGEICETKLSKTDAVRYVGDHEPAPPAACELLGLPTSDTTAFTANRNGNSKRRPKLKKGIRNGYDINLTNNFWHYYYESGVVCVGGTN